MKSELYFRSITPQHARQYLQVIVPVFALLGFLVAATPTIANPPQVASTLSPTATTLSQTKTPTLQRTNTPTKSATPRLNTGRAPIATWGQPQVMTDTIALYHFDAPNGNLAVDATGNYTGTLFGDAMVDTTGLYGGVLHLHGNGGIQIPTVFTQTQGTIEVFVDIAAGCPASSNIPLMAFYDTNGNLVAQWIWGGNVFGILTPTRWQWADTGINACQIHDEYIRTGLAL